MASAGSKLELKGASPASVDLEQQHLEPAVMFREASLVLRRAASSHRSSVRSFSYPAGVLFQEPVPADEERLQNDRLPELFDRSYWRSRHWRWWLLMRWWPGCNLPELLLCVVIGLILVFAVPCPDGIERSAWTQFGVFVATIAGLILRPLPMGGVALVSTVTCLWSNLLSFDEAFEGFTESVVWLIVAALLMAQAVDKSGLGYRLSLLFIAAVGGTSLGLTYALMGADLILAMAMPSTTAREGGVFLPIIRGISHSFGSFPDDYASSKRLGAFLTMAQLQHTQPTSAMWLTGAAPNALAIGLAKKQGVQLPAGDWVTWVQGSSIPALAIMAITPLIVFWLYPPGVKRTPEAPREARKVLRELGRLSYGEVVTLVVLLFAVAFWICGGYIKPPISSTSVALMALALLLLSGVLKWEDCIQAAFAWDTLCWLSLLMSQSVALTNKGVYDWFADRIAARLGATGMPPVGLWALLLVIYVFIHYIFASQSAHVAALYAPFLAVMLRSNISPTLAAMSLAYVGNALTGMTHYASAESVVYFTQKYYTVRSVWAVGFVMTCVNLAVWIPLGLGWWKAVGFYSDISTMQ